jgi:hypothetical protein
MDTTHPEHGKESDLPRTGRRSATRNPKSVFQSGYKETKIEAIIISLSFEPWPVLLNLIYGLKYEEVSCNSQGAE